MILACVLIRPHRIQKMEMRTTVIDDPGVCQSVMQAAVQKTAKRIDVLFGVETPGDPPRRGEGVRCGFHRITLATCYLWVLLCEYAAVW